MTTTGGAIAQVLALSALADAKEGTGAAALHGGLANQPGQP
jgi:hypothetical protein